METIDEKSIIVKNLPRRFGISLTKIQILFTQRTKGVEKEGRTLTAAVTAWPTRPGSDCHVPRPNDGI